MKIEMVSWDWKEQPSFVELARVIQSVSRGRVWMYDVETGSDEYAVVFADRELTPEQVTETWQGRFRDG